MLAGPSGEPVEGRADSISEAWSLALRLTPALLASLMRRATGASLTSLTVVMRMQEGQRGLTSSQ